MMEKQKVVMLAIISFMLLHCIACSNDNKNSKEVMPVTLSPTSAGSTKSSKQETIFNQETIYNQDKSIKLTKIEEGIWVYTTSKRISGSNIPANGLIVASSEGLILIDTPWNDEKTKALVDFTEDIFGKSIVLAVITHAHDDRVGGIHELLEREIKAISTEQTADLAEKAGFDRPLAEINNDVEPMEVGDVQMELYYPGEGHTSDNIVVWFPDHKLLYGGCFIKSMDSKNVGNTSDANLEKWPASIKKVMESYTDIRTVIPGHGEWGGSELLDHTLELLQDDTSDKRE